MLYDSLLSTNNGLDSLLLKPNRSSTYNFEKNVKKKELQNKTHSKNNVTFFKNIKAK